MSEVRRRPEDEKLSRDPAAMPTMERLWGVRDVAAYLGKSERWVRGEVALSRIPFLRIGRSVRFEAVTMREYARGEWIIRRK